MTDLIIPGEGLTPAGGVLVAKAGQRIFAEAGVRTATVNGGLYLPPDATGVEVDETVRFLAAPGFNPAANAASLVQWCSPSAEFRGEVDMAGRPLIGVQFARYSAGSPTPSGTVRGARVHSNALAAGDTTVGYNHAFYFRYAEGVLVEDVNTWDIRGGGAYHFFGEHPVNNWVDGVTSQNDFAFLYLWGASVTGNTITDALVLDQNGRSEKDGIVRGGGETNNFVDYVTVPTEGYGVTPKPSTAELAAEARAHLLETTISGTEYLRRKANGYRGRPYAWERTHWGKALGLLDEIEAG